MSLDSLLNQSGTLETPNGQDRYGNSSFAAPVAVKTRFQRVTKTMINAKGESEPIDGLAFFSGATSVVIGQRFVYGGTNFRVMVISEEIDGRGVVRHKQVMLQVWR